MHLVVNDEHYDLAHINTVAQLLHHLQQPLTGIALAINNTIVPRQAWNSHLLQDGDHIVLFQAIAGG